MHCGIMDTSTAEYNSVEEVKLKKILLERNFKLIHHNEISEDQQILQLTFRPMHFSKKHKKQIIDQGKQKRGQWSNSEHCLDHLKRVLEQPSDQSNKLLPSMLHHFSYLSRTTSTCLSSGLVSFFQQLLKVIAFLHLQRPYAEAYLEPSQKSTMEFFCKNS